MGKRGPTEKRVLAPVSYMSGDELQPSSRRGEIEDTTGFQLSDETWKRVDIAMQPLVFARKGQSALPLTAKKRNENHPSWLHYDSERKRALRRLKKIKKHLESALHEVNEMDISHEQWKAMSSAVRQKTGENPRLGVVWKSFLAEIHQSHRLAYTLRNCVENADEPPSSQTDDLNARAWAMQRLKRALEGELDTDAPREIRVGGPTEIQRFVLALGVYDLPYHREQAIERLAELLSDDLRRDLDEGEPTS